MNATDHTTGILDSLLRGELSAIETYGQAIHKFTDSPTHPDLREMRRDHINSVQTLRDLIHQRGGVPSTSSGSWGNLAGTIEAVAGWFGEDSALAALRQGEQHGIREYHEVLLDHNVDHMVKDAIRDELLPPLHRHVEVLAHS